MGRFGEGDPGKCVCCRRAASSMDLNRQRWEKEKGGQQQEEELAPDGAGGGSQGHPLASALSMKLVRPPSRLREAQSELPTAVRRQHSVRRALDTPSLVAGLREVWQSMISWPHHREVSDPKLKIPTRQPFRILSLLSPTVFSVSICVSVDRFPHTHNPQTSNSHAGSSCFSALNSKRIPTS